MVPTLFSYQQHVELFPLLPSFAIGAPVGILSLNFSILFSFGNAIVQKF